MEEKINIKSDEITEILGTPPRWIIRWGITVVFMIIAVVLIGSIFFRYPDTVVAPVIITAENPPSVVVSRTTGKPAILFVEDGQWVTCGDTLCVIESNANYVDVFILSKIVSKRSSSELVNDSSFSSLSSKKLILGDLQSVYNTFSRAYNELVIFQKQKYHMQKIVAIENEHKQYQIYFDRLWSQRNLTLKDLSITQKQFNRDSTLFSSGVIAAADFEKSQAQLLTKKQALESSRISLSNAAITIERLKQSIADTRLEYESQRIKLEEEFANAHRQIISSMAGWEKMYLLIASSTGKLSFMNVWSDLQEVKSGDPLFSITPDDIGEIQARMVIPFEGAGKVKSGQHVNIKLDGYSYMEFGMIEGIVISISSGYSEKGFPSIVHLSKGTTTSYGIKIPFERELTGTAEITTEDLWLLQRLFSPLKHIYKSKIKK
jgi:HlyD family secretion protein